MLLLRKEGVMDSERLLALVEELRAYTNETSWIEFKENNADPERIGKLISALAIPPLSWIDHMASWYGASMTQLTRWLVVTWGLYYSLVSDFQQVPL